MHIAAELLDEIEEAVCQLLLMLERHHHPVGLVGAVERSLQLGSIVVVHHLLRDLRHLVGSSNGATHEHRLRHHGRCHEHVARVGV